MNRMTEAQQVEIRKALLDASNPLTHHSGVDIVRAALHTSNLLNDLYDLGYRSLRIVQGRIIGTFTELNAAILVIGLAEGGIHDCSYFFNSAAEADVSCSLWDGSGHPQGAWLKMFTVRDGKSIVAFR